MDDHSKGRKGNSVNWARQNRSFFSNTNRKRPNHKPPEYTGPYQIIHLPNTLNIRSLTPPKVHWNCYRVTECLPTSESIQNKTLKKITEIFWILPIACWYWALFVLCKIPLAWKFSFNNFRLVFLWSKKKLFPNFQVINYTCEAITGKTNVCKVLTFSSKCILNQLCVFNLFRWHGTRDPIYAFLQNVF